MEFMVNQVGKDKISGYLSVPKVNYDARAGRRQLSVTYPRLRGSVRQKGAPSSGAPFF